MSIYLEFQFSNGAIDGTTIYTFDPAQWSRAGDNQFVCALDAAQNLGIIDPLPLIAQLDRLAFPGGGPAPAGNIFGDVAADVGSPAMITDLIVERVITQTPGNTVAPTLGTHSPRGVPDAAGVRVRETPTALPTLVATQHQAGGSGQVSTTLLANGQAGINVCPTGMRLWFLSTADAGDHFLGLWLFPVAGPDIAEGILAGQPLAQFA